MKRKTGNVWKHLFFFGPNHRNIIVLFQHCGNGVKSILKFKVKLVAYSVTKTQRRSNFACPLGKYSSQKAVLWMLPLCEWKYCTYGHTRYLRHVWQVVGQIFWAKHGLEHRLGSACERFLHISVSMSDNSQVLSYCTAEIIPWLNTHIINQAYSTFL